MKNLERITMRFKSVALLLTVVALTFLMSCATLEQLVVPPDVKVENINIADFSFEDVTLDFGLLVNNPNPFGVDLQGYAYKFAVEGKEFLSANETRQINVGAAANSNINIPVTINFKELYNLMQETKDLDSLTFDLVGNLQPGGLLSAFDIPFSKKGSLPNVRIPEIKFSGLKVKKMGFTGIDLEVGLDLVNNNVFGFDIGKLNYDIALAGNPLIKGMTEQLASVPAKGKSSVKLPVSLDLSGALGSISSILKGNSVEATITGDTDLNTPFGPITLPFNTTQNIPILK
jgi:LEA14-like dessication related protein